MIDDVSDIRAFYDEDPEREHRRLERGLLEYDITWRYLEQYLPAQGTILEIGAATGRYTLELAKRGYQVTAVDLSAPQLETARSLIKSAGLENQVEFIAADARDLNAVTHKAYDAVLLMGPLYHLIAEEDRKRALQQAFDRLRSGGLLFSAFLSRFGIMGDLINKIPEWIEDQTDVQALLATGRRPDDYPRGGFRAYFALVPEIAPLHEAIGFQTLTLAGVEPALSADVDMYHKLEGKQRQLWLDLLFKISADPSIVGASMHLLYIGQKP